ncbi:MAG TPA: hypothetical protein VF021_11535, partial [Longimicrobiales bacterium]
MRTRPTSRTILQNPKLLLISTVGVALLLLVIDLGQMAWQFALQGRPLRGVLRLAGWGTLEWLVRSTIIPVAVLASARWP